MPEIEKVIAELKNLMDYYEKNAAIKPNMTGLVLSSRKNMCIHPEVSKEREGKAVDGKCYGLTAGHVRERHRMDDTVPVCQWYEGTQIYANTNIHKHPKYIEKSTLHKHRKK